VSDGQPLPRRRATVHRGFRVRIDLTGSMTHPSLYRSIEVNGVWPEGWSGERLREMAAEWAGVPLHQVGEPLPGDTTRVRL
jgi:hypothetical protein